MAVVAEPTSWLHTGRTLRPRPWRRGSRGWDSRGAARPLEVEISCEAPRKVEEGMEVDAATGVGAEVAGSAGVRAPAGLRNWGFFPGARG